MRIYYREGMKSKESNSPRRQEALEPRTYGGICCEQWAILTERKGREEGERGAKLDTVQFVNSLGCRESCLMKSPNYLAKEEVNHQLR